MWNWKRLLLLHHLWLVLFYYLFSCGGRCNWIRMFYLLKSGRLLSRSYTVIKIISVFLFYDIFFFFNLFFSFDYNFSFLFINLLAQYHWFDMINLCHCQMLEILNFLFILLLENWCRKCRNDRLHLIVIMVMNFLFLCVENVLKSFRIHRIHVLVIIMRLLFGFLLCQLHGFLKVAKIIDWWGRLVRVNISRVINWLHFIKIKFMNFLRSR